MGNQRTRVREAVLAHGAQLGIAWDGDFDRCFLFDERGNFIEGYYIVGLLASVFLARQPGSRIIHDPRLTWNTVEMVQEAGIRVTRRRRRYLRVLRPVMSELRLGVQTAPWP